MLRVRPRSRVGSLFAVGLLLGALGAAPLAAPGHARLTATYSFNFESTVGTPLWWQMQGAGAPESVRAFRVTEIPAESSAILSIELASDSGRVHVHVWRAYDPPPATSPAFLLGLDPTGGAKSIRLGAPGPYVVLVDPGPGAAFDLTVTFNGVGSDGVTPRGIHVVDLGASRCPVWGLTEGCPP